MRRARLGGTLAAAFLSAAAAFAAPAPRDDSPLTGAEAASFAARLEEAVTLRLRVLPEADDALASLAFPCASRVAPIRPRAFREPAPRLISLPGGLVLVSTGLAAAAASDAELVSALAHEAGHVAAGEALDRLTRAYGSALLRRIAAGERADALGAMAANIAAGGVLTFHGRVSEDAAEDAARRAGCAGGLARVLQRAGTEGRRLRPGRQAHPLRAPTASDFPGHDDPAVDGLVKLRLALGPAP